MPRSWKKEANRPRLKLDSGHYQSIVIDREFYFGGFFPGDHQSINQREYRWKRRSPQGPQGKCDHGPIDSLWHGY